MPVAQLERPVERQSDAHQRQQHTNLGEVFDDDAMVGGAEPAARHRAEADEDADRHQHHRCAEGHSSRCGGQHCGEEERDTCDEVAGTDNGHSVFLPVGTVQPVIDRGMFTSR